LEIKKKGDTVIGGMEWIILLLFVVLLLFGAKKIPEFARSLGKAKAEFQRGQMMIEREIKDEQQRYDEKQSKKKPEDVVKAAKALGIETEGKTETELKSEIATKVG
jgi:sec-independent protein translocase protein TatA